MGSRGKTWVRLRGRALGLLEMVADVLAATIELGGDMASGKALDHVNLAVGLLRGSPTPVKNPGVPQ